MSHHFQSRPMLSGQETQRGDTLIFPRATRHQAGLYTCSADNGSGKPASAKVEKKKKYLYNVKI